MIHTEVYFEDHKSVIEREIRAAKSSIYVAVAWINFKTYAELFRSVLERDVELNIICSDNWQNRSHQEEISKLIKHGAVIRLLKMPYTRNYMHHKFAVIDQLVILNGSFNWSPNAEKSIENLMVVRNAGKEVNAFLEEFQRLLSIETDILRELQKKKKCQVTGCRGQLHNILVLSERSNKYYETFGDIVSVCTECEEFTTVKRCIPNTRFEILLSGLGAAADDYELEIIEKDIFDLLVEYQNDENTIHAIGKVKTTLDGHDEEWVSTKIIWKNKFVGNSLRDEFDDQDFDVGYDN